MRVGLKSFLFLFLLLAGCSKPISQTRETIDFGAKEIAERLCRLGPRDSCTPGAAAAANWIASELQFSGYKPKIDKFNDPTADGKERIFRNVIATLKGTGDKHYLLLSHYDTKSGISPDFVGANDGGSSTALLLALANHFRLSPPDATLTFAFLDGEECKDDYGPYDGLHGSRHLAAQLKASRVRVDGVILLDMVGDKDLLLTIPVNSSARLISILQRAAKATGIDKRVRETTMELRDDHVPFLQLGYHAIDIIDFDYGSSPGRNDYWHTPEDSIDKLSDSTLNMVGTLVVEMIDQLCDIGK